MSEITGKPTPGEWRTQRVSDGTRIMAGRVILAKLTSRTDIPRSEHEANARLFSAAKEMLNALLLIRDSATDGREIPEWLAERLESHVKPAIGKATGAAE